MQQEKTRTASEAFVSALTGHQAALRGYCQASLGNGQEALEALQRANVVLWKKHGEWDPQTEFLRWALAVTRYEVLGVIRDRQRDQRRVIFDSDVVERMAEEAVELTDAETATQSALERCLRKVSPRNQAILTAFYTDGESTQTIARLFNRGQSAVKVQLMRLRSRLRECIEGQLARKTHP